MLARKEIFYELGQPHESRSFGDANSHRRHYSGGGDSNHEDDNPAPRAIGDD